MSDTNSISVGQSNAFKAPKHLTPQVSTSSHKCKSRRSKKRHKKSSGSNYRHAAYFRKDCKTFKEVHNRESMFIDRHKRGKVQANENFSRKIRHQSSTKEDNEPHQDTPASSISRTENFQKRKQMQQKVRKKQSVSKHIFPQNGTGLSDSAKDQKTPRIPRSRKRSNKIRQIKSKAKKSDNAVDDNCIDKIWYATIENSTEGSRLIEDKEMFLKSQTCNTVINKNAGYQSVQKSSVGIKNRSYNKQTSSTHCFVGKNYIHPLNSLTSQSSQGRENSETPDIYEDSSYSENQSDSELFFFDITGDYSRNQNKIIDSSQTKGSFSKICNPSLVEPQCSDTEKEVVTEFSTTIESDDIQTSISFNQFNFDDLRDSSESSEDEVTMVQFNGRSTDRAIENHCDEICGEKFKEKGLDSEYYAEQYNTEKDYVSNSYSSNIRNKKFISELVEVEDHPNNRKCNGQLLAVDESMSELESDHGHKVNKASRNSIEHKKDQNRNMGYEIIDENRPWDAKRNKPKENVFKTEYGTRLSEMTNYDIQELQDIQNIDTNPEILEDIDNNIDNSKLLNGTKGKVQTNMEAQEGIQEINLESERPNFWTKILSELKIEKKKRGRKLVKTKMVKKTQEVDKNYKVMKKIETPLSKINKKKHFKNNKGDIQLLCKILGTKCNDMQEENDEVYEANEYPLQLRQEELGMEDVQTDIEVQEGNPNIQVEDENIDFEIKVLPKFKTKKKKCKRNSANPEVKVYEANEYPLQLQQEELEIKDVQTDIGMHEGNPNIQLEDENIDFETKVLPKFKTKNKKCKRNSANPEVKVYEANEYPLQLRQEELEIKDVQTDIEVQEGNTNIQLEDENMDFETKVLPKFKMKKKKLKRSYANSEMIQDTQEMQNTSINTNSEILDKNETSSTKIKKNKQFEYTGNSELQHGIVGVECIKVQEENVGSPTTDKSKMTKKVKRKKKLKSNVTKMEDINAGANLLGKEKLETHSNTTVIKKINKKSKDIFSIPDSPKMYNGRYTDSSGAFEFQEASHIERGTILPFEDDVNGEDDKSQRGAFEFQEANHIERGTILPFEDDVNGEDDKSQRENQSTTELLENILGSRPTLLEELKKNVHPSEVTESVEEHNVGIPQKQIMSKDQISTNLNETSSYTIAETKIKNKENYDEFQTYPESLESKAKNNMVCRLQSQQSCRKNGKLHETYKDNDVESEVLISDELGKEIRGMQANETQFKWSDLVQMASNKGPKKVREKKCKNFIHIIDSDCEMHVTLNEQNYEGLKSPDRDDNQTFYIDQNDRICKEFVDIDSDCTMRTTLTNTRKRKRNKKSNEGLEIVDRDISQTLSSGENDSICKEFVDIVDSDCTMRTSLTNTKKRKRHKKSNEGPKIVDGDNSQTVFSGENNSICKEFVDIVDSDCTMGTTLINTRKKKKNKKSNEGLKIADGDKDQTFNSEENYSICKELVDIVDSDCTMRTPLTNTKTRKRNKKSNVRYDEYLEDDAPIQSSLSNIDSSTGNVSSNQNGDTQINDMNDLGNESNNSLKDYEYSTQVQLKSKENIDTSNHTQESKETSQVGFNGSESQKELNSGTTKSYYSNSPKENICLESEKKTKKHKRNEPPSENSDICSQKFKARRSRHIEADEHELELQEEELEFEHIQSDTKLQEGSQGIELEQKQIDFDAKKLSESEIKKKKRRRAISKTEIVQKTHETRNIDINFKILQRKLCDQNEESTENFINGMNSSDSEQPEKKQSHNLENASDKSIAEKTVEQTNPMVSCSASTEPDEITEELRLEKIGASSEMESMQKDETNSIRGLDEVKVNTQEIKQPYGDRDALIKKIYTWRKGLFNKNPQEVCGKSIVVQHEVEKQQNEHNLTDDLTIFKIDHSQDNPNECRKSTSENKCLTFSQLCETSIDEAGPDESFHSENSDSDSVNSESLVIEEKIDTKELSLSVPFSIPPLHEHLADSKQESEAANLGIALKKGPFNKEEDKQIMDNWTYFCQFHNLKANPEDFFNIRRMRVVERLKFLQFLAHGMDTRKLHRVHMRFKTIFKKNMVRRGRYTAEEDAQILAYVKNTKSYTPYKDLAELFNRTNLSVQRRYETLTKARNTGRVVWDVRSMAKFVAKLMRIKKVKDVRDLKDVELVTNEWRKLSKKLDYIPIERLRRAWNITIYPRLFAESVDLVQMKKDIITMLYESDINDWKLIDWKSISEKYAGYTSQKVYMLFRQTMAQHVPKEKHGDVRECLSYLMHNVIEKDKLRPPHTIKRFIAEMSEESSESEDDTKKLHMENRDER